MEPTPHHPERILNTHRHMGDDLFQTKYSAHPYVDTFVDPYSPWELTVQMTPSMRDADAVASKAQTLVRDGNLEEACLVLDPLAFGRTKFPILDRVGARLGQAHLENASLLDALDRMISRGSVGYYVVVGSALAQLLESNMITCLRKTGEYIVLGNDWAKCKIG